MKNSFTRIILTTTALLLSTSLAFAVDVTVKTPDVKGTAKATSDTAKDKTKGAVTDAKTTAKAKIVDINTASEAELKAIPGIGDAYATKIIAGRPYANKAQLKSRKILPGMAYEQVKDLIIAKQPKK